MTSTESSSEKTVVPGISNAEFVKLCGFRTNATGSELAELARKLTGGGSYINKSVIGHPSLTFEPFYFFFYGSLQAEKTLMRACRLTDPNLTLIPASITGWKVMMWGRYPSLIPAEGNEVKGMCWKCEKPKHVALLRFYETDAYRMEFCKITTGTGGVIENGRVFVSAVPEDLVEGTFDLLSYIGSYNNS
ncbi:uncharacterized protein F4812DRAFT_459931 [Daldinia caldariorum]|uniref:uncharacterized protein n=1 Tax=Daldinia caldariorum TaxID=326644 RepID=UPI002007429F|nr:uncharacterized protein F4812DRAFT_459931 [Daldinia caldariorum]KAI1467084.1 hypothetical protein F4812DRAFT_459931 [Daldinia caldariorum]